jgi:hypothetical protein
MQQDRWKFVAVALIAVVGVGASALAKSSHSGKAGTAGVARAEHSRALRANEPVHHAPTYGAPNSSHPALTGGGGGYNINLYNW